MWWFIWPKKVWINFYVVSPGHTWMKIHFLCPYYKYIVVERRTRPSSKDDHVVISRTCDCLMWQRDFAGKIKLRIWGGKIILDYLYRLTVTPGAHVEEHRRVRVKGNMLTLQSRGRKTRNLKLLHCWLWR